MKNWLYEQIFKRLSDDKAATYQQFLGKENKIVTRTIEPSWIVIIEEVNKRVLSRDKEHDEKWEKYHRPNED